MLVNGHSVALDTLVVATTHKRTFHQADVNVQRVFPEKSVSWSVVFRHGTCVLDMSARVLGRFSLVRVNNKANGKVTVDLRGNPGREAFRRTLEGPFAWPTHNSSVIDPVRLL